MDIVITEHFPSKIPMNSKVMDVNVKYDKVHECIRWLSGTFINVLTFIEGHFKNILPHVGGSGDQKAAELPSPFSDFQHLTITFELTWYPALQMVTNSIPIADLISGRYLPLAGYGKG